jgi:hypothetical protein
MKKLLIVLVIFLTYGCSSTANNSQFTADLSTSSTDPQYGYIESKPVELGGFMRGTKYEGAHFEYFRSLLGPQGQKVKVERLGSCCEFEDASLPLGGGLLDRYELTYEGQKKPAVIYVNLYRFEQPKAPQGFTLL